jgi:hypothetical protein
MSSETTDTEETSAPHLANALKAAASAAAVGAAVGAARALSARRHDDDADDEEPEEEAEDTEEPVDEAEPEPEPEDEREEEEDVEPEPEPATAEPAPPGDLRRVVDDARRLLLDLQGADAESVSSVSRTGDGWTVALEVVEVRRIPDSTDVLASYEVELDGDGGVRRFERVRRYRRTEADWGGRS